MIRRLTFPVVAVCVFVLFGLVETAEAWKIQPVPTETDLVAAFGKPLKIEQAPFYAFPSTAYILGTYGGILTNEKAQVVDIFGQTVPGLYAAGEIIGGVHGAAYMTGTAFGKTLIFGRIAAKSVLAQK